MRFLKILLPLFLLFLFSSAALADIEISEVMTSNGVYANGEAYDWVELHNTGKKSVNLSGCFLSDSKKKPAADRVSPAGCWTSR